MAEGWEAERRMDCLAQLGQAGPKASQMHFVLALAEAEPASEVRLASGAEAGLPSAEVRLRDCRINLRSSLAQKSSSFCP